MISVTGFCQVLTDHNGSAFWVNSQILSWNDPATPALSERLLMNLLERVLGRNVFQNYNFTRVGPDYQVV